MVHQSKGTLSGRSWAIPANLAVAHTLLGAEFALRRHLPSLEDPLRTPWTLALLLPTSLACAPRWAAAPHVPNPVLLGPVDRVGGHHAAGGVVVGVVDDEVNAFVSASTSEHREGRYIVRETVSHQRLDGSYKWSPAILEATQGARNVDLRVSGLDVGCYVFLTPGSGMMEKWVRLRGEAVRPSNTP